MATTEPGLRRRDESGARRPSVVFYILLAAGLLVFIRAFALLSPILLSLLLTFLISLAINPVVARMRAWSGGRRGATGVLVLVLVGIMGLTGWAIFVPLQDSVTKFVEQLPEYWERLQKPLIKLEHQAVNLEDRIEAEVTREIAQDNATEGETVAETTVTGPSLEPERAQAEESEPKAGSVRSSLGQVFQEGLGRFSAMAFNATQILVVLGTVFFGVIYTLINPHPILGALFSLVPAQHHEQTLTIVRRIGEFVPRWAGATLVGMLSIGFLVFLLMWPFFGFMDALVLGLIAGMLEGVPYLGPVLAAVPALLLAIGEGGMTPLWIVGAYLAVQALENNVILPFIMARGMKLHPLAVIFSMLLCVAAFGVLGVIVAAPLVAIVGIFHEELYRKRFLATVTDADLVRLSREALFESEPTRSISE